MMETVIFFGEVLDHTCTIVQAGTQTGSYGHTDWNWTTPTASTLLVPCRYEQSSATEMVDERLQGTTVSTHTVWLRYSAAPASLLVPGANVNHRVTTIKTSTGVTIDAGPFDVTEVADLANVRQVLRLQLRRIV